LKLLQNLLTEIQRYQTVLDDVKSKGYTQIERYVVSVPSLQASIERQLQNVQESYNSLLNTAIQIRVSIDFLNIFISKLIAYVEKCNI
jgi:nesprin-1